MKETMSDWKSMNEPAYYVTPIEVPSSPESREIPSLMKLPDSDIRKLVAGARMSRVAIEAIEKVIDDYYGKRAEDAEKASAERLQKRAEEAAQAQQHKGFVRKYMRRDVK